MYKKTSTRRLPLRRFPDGFESQLVGEVKNVGHIWLRSSHRSGGPNSSQVRLRDAKNAAEQGVLLKQQQQHFLYNELPSVRGNRLICTSQFANAHYNCVAQ